MYKRMSFIWWGLIIGGIVASTIGVQWGLTYMHLWFLSPGWLTICHVIISHI